MTRDAQFRLADPVHFLALGFGSGLLSPAPGTWGTLAAIPVYLFLVLVWPSNALLYFLLLGAGFALGVFVCGKAAQDVGVHDHSAIVWDEIIGFLITMSFVNPSWQNIVLGFVLFRLFDIVKPWPIKRLDKSVHGGFGIMIDDVLAGAIACGLLYLAQSPMARILA